MLVFIDYFIFKTFFSNCNIYLFTKQVWMTFPQHHINPTSPLISNQQSIYHPEDEEQQTLKFPYSESNSDVALKKVPFPPKILKPIRKSQKATTKGKFSIESEERRGRPSKDEIDKQFSQKSKQFNNIIYHYSRSLIFLRLIKEEQKSIDICTLNLQEVQKQWIAEAGAIMNIDNFPSIDERNQIFLLHPNSLHFIIQHNKVNKNYLAYTSQKLKFYFLAVISKKSLFTPKVYTYILQYWTDIVHLVKINRNKGKKTTNNRQLYVEYQDDQSTEGTAASMKAELEKDSSIGAYEIACYLKSCCEHFNVMIEAQAK